MIGLSHSYLPVRLNKPCPRMRLFQGAVTGEIVSNALGWDFQPGLP